MRTCTAVALLLVWFVAAPSTQTRITTPKEALGFNFGDDYQLANYQQISGYWRTLARQSDRIVVEQIGLTAEGRPHLMAIVTSPENHATLARYREIARRLALADGLTDDDARALAKEGKAVVWIDGGLHATEVLGAQQLGEMVYQMVSRTDDETLRLLNDCIILLVHANPDGNDLVADWYMRNPLPERRTLAGLPRLYQKYIGHDNNRDFFASTQAETENINRVLYREWFPEILYNHHQSGPAGTVLWSPPLRDPFNYNQDPLLVLELQMVGTAMHTRLAAEGKPGATMRSGGPYDGWWNGGIRNTAAFHNIIALLTEMVGSPTPMRIPLVMQRQLPTSDLVYPIAPQEWHFRQSIDYSISLNRAVLDIASRMKENVLFNIYRMGKNIIPAGQPDFPTATKFVNALLETGITVKRATRNFEVQGKTYPAGSYVVMSAQAFRPHVMDMFERQDHPNVFPYPGAPPTPPYDNAGWTLAFQMGIQFDRILEGFSGPFETITEWNTKPPAGTVTNRAGAKAFVMSHRANDAFVALNRLLALGEAVRWVRDGSFHIAAGRETANTLRTLSGELGLSFEGTSQVVATDGLILRRPRVGLWDQYGGSIDAGWARWILEQFGFAFERTFPPMLDAGDLSARYDALVFVDGAIPAVEGGRGGSSGGAFDMLPADVPAEYRGQLGRISADRTLPRIKQFVEAGGTVVAIGSSATNLARFLALPVTDHLVENGQPLPRTKFFAPGSVLAMHVDTSNPFAQGMEERTDAFFDNSPVFRLAPDARSRGVKSLAWFERNPLRSGWAWGQQYLEGGVAAVDASVGKGHVLLYGPEILQRAQPHGTFKLLFNALYLAAAQPETR